MKAVARLCFYSCAARLQVTPHLYENSRKHPVVFQTFTLPTRSKWTMGPEGGANSLMRYSQFINMSRKTASPPAVTHHLRNYSEAKHIRSESLIACQCRTPGRERASRLSRRLGCEGPRPRKESFILSSLDKHHHKKSYFIQELVVDMETHMHQFKMFAQF